MSKKLRKRKNTNSRIEQPVMPKYYSKDEMIEMQAEAYCRALEMAEDRKKKKFDEAKEKARNIKFKEKMKLLFWMLIIPNKAREKVELREDITNGLFAIVSFFFVAGIGHVIRILAIIFGVCLIIALKTNSILFIDLIFILPIIIFAFIFGSILILSGQEIAEERDPSKTNTYTTGVFALVSMIVALISLFK